MNNITFKDYGYIYQICGGIFNDAPKNLNEFLSYLNDGGLEPSGVNINNSHRDELQGAPKFNRISGPMYNGIRDGKILIRYESKKE